MAPDSDTYSNLQHLVKVAWDVAGLQRLSRDRNCLLWWPGRGVIPGRLRSWWDILGLGNTRDT